MNKVLIVDDEPRVRNALREVLLKEGFDVEEASDGQKGMVLWRNNPAAILLIDIFMPDKEGIETIMELKRSWPKAKIIAMSGQPDMLIAAKLLGADKTLVKPIHRQCLFDAIHSVLSQPADV